MTTQVEQAKKAAQALATVLVVLLVVVIAQALSEVTWRVVVGDDSVELTTNSGSLPGVSASGNERGENHQTKRMPNIAQWNLFGVENKNTASVKQVQAEVKAPETKLRLELKGVYVADQANNSSAIVADKGKSERYLIGDKMPGGVTLNKVFYDRVLLARGSRLETLRFSEKSLKSGAVARKSTRSKSSRSRKGSLLDQMRSGAVQNPKDIVAKLSENSGQVLSSMINEVGLEDLSQTGEGEGFRVGASAPKDVLSAVGLRRGDVVHSVNGQPLGDIQSDPNLMQEILASGKAKIEIQRGKRRFVVTYPIPKF
ncbi:MAG: hypothetical protein COB51_04690 [Moraxellaceae bacterium]|nr:MAG: hypothetical protein COB51_04690 [Moraxellaceae bacterium]